MIFTPLSIGGAYEITLERIGDHRGFFARLYCDTEFGQLGLNTQWPQMNLSFTQTKGTVRGLHFQRPPAGEVKLLRCTRGMVLDVFLDMREKSETFGQHATVVLEADKKNAVYIPEGCAHGFQTLSDDVELQYFHSHPYAPECEGGVNSQDAALGINWPLPVSQISARDQALPLFTDCEPL